MKSRIPVSRELATQTAIIHIVGELDRYTIAFVFGVKTRLRTETKGGLSCVARSLL
jgi:hypothetical protein